MRTASLMDLIIIGGVILVVITLALSLLYGGGK